MREIRMPVTPRKILVVDDGEEMANSLATLLRTMGHKVAVAHDGFAALDQARYFRPDVILLDIALPRLDGYEVARRLRTEHGRNVLIIALTGFVQDQDRQKAVEAGFDHHVAKPVDHGFLNSLLGARVAS